MIKKCRYCYEKYKAELSSDVFCSQTCKDWYFENIDDYEVGEHLGIIEKK